MLRYQRARIEYRGSIITIIGSINCTAVSFLILSGLGRRIAEVSGETRNGSFPFQRLSVLIQRLIHDLLFLPISTVESGVS